MMYVDTKHQNRYHDVCGSTCTVCTYQQFLLMTYLAVCHIIQSKRMRIGEFLDHFFLDCPSARRKILTMATVAVLCLTPPGHGPQQYSLWLYIWKIFIRCITQTGNLFHGSSKKHGHHRNSKLISTRRRVRLTSFLWPKKRSQLLWKYCPASMSSIGQQRGWDDREGTNIIDAGRNPCADGIVVIGAF